MASGEYDGGAEAFEHPVEDERIGDVHDQLVTGGGEAAMSLEPVLVVLLAYGTAQGVFDCGGCEASGVVCAGGLWGLCVCMMDPNLTCLIGVIVTEGLRHAPDLPLPAASAHRSP